MTPQERRELEMAFAANEDWGSFARDFLGRDAVDELERGIAQWMAEKGRPLDPDPTVANFNGGELTQRLKAEVRRVVLVRLDNVKTMVTLAVCEKYCDLKKRGLVDNEGLKIAMSVADALLSVKIGFPAPVSRTASYIVRNGVLDQWCDCPARR